MNEHTANKKRDDQSVRMTQDQMQTEALVIETLLEAVVALSCSTKSSDAAELIDMAQSRARQLNIALDLVNRDKVRP
ncbi:MAG: hypothetical protein NXH97_18270 [Rhodobacteraceae bacterium]|nr:hypothetical protein [Paracoccaceae bacterium]